MSAINLNVNCFAVIRVQSLFSWRPGDMTNPQPSFFSFKSVIKNPKMKVRFHISSVLKGKFFPKFIKCCHACNHWNTFVNFLNMN